MRPKSTRPAVYRIRVRGCIGERWGPWLDGMAITPGSESGETFLTGAVMDQAALLGLLQKLHNLGLQVLEVRVEEHGVPEAGAQGETKED